MPIGPPTVALLFRHGCALPASPPHNQCRTGLPAMD